MKLYLDPMRKREQGPTTPQGFLSTKTVYPMTLPLRVLVLREITHGTS